MRDRVVALHHVGLDVAFQHVVKLVEAFDLDPLARDSLVRFAQIIAQGVALGLDLLEKGKPCFHLFHAVGRQIVSIKDGVRLMSVDHH